jgi:hypothetical protein
VFSQQCSVNQGSSCSITVVGVSGEYDPFAGKTGSGLKLQSIGAGATSCQVAAIGMQGTTAITVTWPSGQNAYGGECVVPFTVADAQGRTGDGRVTVDLLGLPQAPASISTSDYTANSVTLEVSLGEALRAHPPVTGIEILEGGSSVGASCSAGAPGVWRCTVSGLVPGQRHDYAARAVNSVGSSAPTSTVTTWSYEAPSVDGVTATPVYRVGRTTQQNGVVALVVTADADVRSFRIAETGEEFARTGQQTSIALDRAPGPQNITVVPISVYEPPTGRGGNEGGSSVTPVTVAGSPYFPNGITASGVNSNTIVVGDLGQGLNGASDWDIVYFAWRNSAAPSCFAQGDGSLGYNANGATVSVGNPTITVPDENRRYTLKACASNGFGVVESGTTTQRAITQIGPPTGNAQYTVGAAPAGGGNSYRYELASGPTMSAIAGFHVEYLLYGSWTTDFVGTGLHPSSSPGTIWARQCDDETSTECTPEWEWVQVTPSNGVPTTVTVDFTDFGNNCVVVPNGQSGTDRGVVVSQAASGSVVLSNPSEPDANGKVSFTVSFTGSYAALDPITRTGPPCQNGNGGGGNPPPAGP